MDTGAFASRSSSLAEWHMAVVPAAHQGGVNVTVCLSLPVHLCVDGLYGPVCDRVCVRAIARNWGVWPWRRDKTMMLMAQDKFGVFAVFRIVWMDAENCVWSTRLYKTAGATADYIFNW